MAVYIHNIATVVPDHVYEQNFLREQMKEFVSDKRTVQSIIHRIYSRSGIQKRHSVVNDFHANGAPRMFFQNDGTLSSPSTGTRNDFYAEQAKELFPGTARKLLDDTPGVTKNDITHLITVSCTGFFAPGPDYEIVKRLDLPKSTQRFHLGFMGCYAAFPALKMAKAFCEADKEAVVLIVCLELCSIHFQHSEAADNLISASVFADGGAGVIVSAKSPTPGKNVFVLERFATSLAEKSEHEMTWKIGDTGFDMVLSTYVPDIIQNNIGESLSPLMESYRLNISEVDHWAVHPGGRSILDKIEQQLELRRSQLDSSRHILANYGNMSSPTVLFVLKHLLDQSAKNRSETIVAMAFGPGLTIESGLFTKISP